MRFVHQPGGIYRGSGDGRHHLFLRWRDPAGRRRYQHLDFATRAEAACFLTGALSACQIAKKVVRFDTLTPDQFAEHRAKQR